MNEDEWCRFYREGTPAVVTVARLSQELRRALGCSTDRARLHHDYVLKVVQKHKIEPFHLPMMERTIEAGAVVMDRPRQLSFFWYDEHVFGRWFQSSLKATVAGDAVWVSTFHPTRWSEVRRHMKGEGVLRPLEL